MVQSQRESLLQGAASYVLEHGFAGLSLRPLAKALGTSDRMLMYHFGSKEALVRAVMERLSADFAGQLGGMISGRVAVDEAARALWGIFTSATAAPYLKAYVELFALSLHEPALYGEAVRTLTEAWVSLLAGALGSGAEARVQATLILGVLDGLFILRQATGDAGTADAALERIAAGWAASVAPAAG